MPGRGWLLNQEVSHPPRFRGLEHEVRNHIQEHLPPKKNVIFLHHQSFAFRQVIQAKFLTRSPTAHWPWIAGTRIVPQH